MKKSLIASVFFLLSAEAMCQISIQIPEFVAGTLASVNGALSTCPAGYITGKFQPVRGATAAGRANISFADFVAGQTASAVQGYCKAGSAFTFTIDGGGPLPNPVCDPSYIVEQRLAELTCDLREKTTAENALLADKLISTQSQLDTTTSTLKVLEQRAADMQKTIEKLRACARTGRACTI